jgi:hypothetical protein
MSVIRDRVLGASLGLAAGDRNEGPVRMAVRLTESLVELRRFDPQNLLARSLPGGGTGRSTPAPRRDEGCPTPFLTPLYPPPTE